MRRLWAICRSRCPRCLKGRVWRGMFSMNERSELLRAGAERTAQAADRRSDSSEDYTLGIPVLALIVLVLWRATGWDILAALVAGDVLFLAAVPLIWRYSRVVWLHLDWLIDPVPAR